ncbi:MAG: hypothetical protein AAB358_03380 [Patescibacteria group bacterium]
MLDEKKLEEVQRRIYEEAESGQELGFHRRRKRKKHSCLKTLIGLIFVFIVLIIIVAAAVRFAVGPAIKTISGLPGDFPKELSIYQPDQAQIKIQTDESKKKIIDLVKAAPDWLSAPVLNWLSEAMKNEAYQNFGSQLNIPQNLTAADLKKTLASTDVEKIQAVSLSWDNLNQTKEQLAAYYKKKLAEADFQFNENLADYQINLGFWKDGIFGTISLSDKKGSTSTAAEIKVNYLNGGTGNPYSQ